uniref:Uncharacterized protein n=1 Tax=Heterorhabditis bacteriophora TaxID=37862 RepID=A0A1I7WGK8_HETBA
MFGSSIPPNRIQCTKFRHLIKSVKKFVSKIHKTFIYFPLFLKVFEISLNYMYIYNFKDLLIFLSIIVTAF